MRTLETLRRTCVDSEALQTAYDGTSVVSANGVRDVVLMQKRIPAHGFYLFTIDVEYKFDDIAAPWVNGTDYFKVDIFSEDMDIGYRSYTPIINGTQGANATYFKSTLVMYCFSGQGYGVSFQGSKAGTAIVSMMETLRIF